MHMFVISFLLLFMFVNLLPWDRWTDLESLISSKTTAFTFQMLRKKNVYFWQKWTYYQLEEPLIKYLGLKWISFSLILLMLDLFSTFKKGLKELNCQDGNSPNFWNSNLAIPYSFPKETWFSLYLSSNIAIVLRTFKVVDSTYWDSIKRIVEYTKVSFSSSFGFEPVSEMQEQLFLEENKDFYIVVVDVLHSFR